MALPPHRYVPGERLLWVGSAKGDCLPTDAEIARVGSTLEGGADLGLVLSPETMEGAGYLQLQVPYFSPEQVGAASRYGPISLEVILAFCKTLDGALRGVAAPGLVCVACSRRPGAYPNSLLLVGAFLILERKFPAKEVVQMLLNSKKCTPLAVSEQRFPPPWKKNAEWSVNSLTIRDCFEGLEAAVKYGWFDYTSFSVGSYRATALAFDCVPVFSVGLALEDTDSAAPAKDRTLVKFWVGADPVTTVVDPQRRSRPSTPASPGSDVARTKSARSVKSLSRPTTSGELGGSARDNLQTLRRTVTMTQQRLFLRSENADVAKERPSGSDDEVARPADLHAFGSWLRDDLRCQLVVRVNQSGERNLPPGGSYGVFFEEHFDMQQLELPFVDGTAPPPHVVASLVGAVRELMAQEGGEGCAGISVLVHCKSGLGRSMSCLGALAMELIPELRPSAYFGWARLVRPGAIQTRVQEDFLRALEKRARSSPARGQSGCSSLFR